MNDETREKPYLEYWCLILWTVFWCCGPSRSSCHVGKFNATRWLKTWINRAQMLSLCKHMMETQSLIKCLFTHISFSVAGCNPSAISRLWSPLTIQIHSPPLASSSHVSQLLPLLPHSPRLTRLPLPSPFALPPPLILLLFSLSPHFPFPLLCSRVSFNYSSLHPWRSEGWGVEAGEGKRVVDGWRRGREKGDCGMGGWCVCVAG